ncbi:hypothetical protein BGT96224_Ac30001 [Blumeria graminis f. sp. tritici 96224]|nr:hypothetical protein BGT96224_Ac30001 [Blumeria graminis f. sp. tritici 96224]
MIDSLDWWNDRESAVAANIIAATMVRLRLKIKNLILKTAARSGWNDDNDSDVSDDDVDDDNDDKQLTQGTIDNYIAVIDAYQQVEATQFHHHHAFLEFNASGES